MDYQNNYRIIMSPLCITDFWWKTYKSIDNSKSDSHDDIKSMILTLCWQTVCDELLYSVLHTEPWTIQYWWTLHSGQAQIIMMLTVLTTSVSSVLVCVPLSLTCQLQDRHSVTWPIVGVNNIGWDVIKFIDPNDTKSI